MDSVSLKPFATNEHRFMDHELCFERYAVESQVISIISFIKSKFTVLSDLATKVDLPLERYCYVSYIM